MARHSGAQRDNETAGGIKYWACDPIYHSAVND